MTQENNWEVQPSQSAVSLFPSVFDKTNGEIVTLGSILERLGDPDPQDYMVHASAHLQQVILDGGTEKQIAQAKTRLPAAEFSLARTNRETTAPLGTFTGLVVIDYDTDNAYAAETEAFKEALHDLEWIVHAQDSAADGVWALVQVYPIPTNSQEFKQAVETLVHELTKRVDHTKYGFKVDKHTYVEKGLRFLSPDITPFGSHDQAVMYHWQDNSNIHQADDEFNIVEIIRSALQANIQDRNDYHGWIYIGMGLYHSAEDLGIDPQVMLQLWDEWSTSGKNYEIGVCAQKWATFGTGNAEGKRKDINWVLNRAREQGWQGGDLQTTVEHVMQADTRATEDHVIEDQPFHPPYTHDDISDWVARVAFANGDIHYNPITGTWYKALITGQGGGLWVPREFKTIKQDAFAFKKKLRQWAYTLGTGNFGKKIQNTVDKWSVARADESIWSSACIPDVLPNELSVKDESLKLFTRKGVMEIGVDNKTVQTVPWDPFTYFNKTILNTWLSNAEINQGYLAPGVEDMFKEFMMMGCDGNEELYDYLSLLLGAALSGELGKSTQLVLFIIGNTGTGKSSFLTGLKTVFGGLCMSVVPKDIQSKTEQHNDALANLIENKVRFAVMDEIAGKNLPVDAMKKLSGGGYYTTRRAYARGNVEGNTRCLVIASGESFPVVKSDPAFERRLRPIEWFGGRTRPTAGKRDMPYHDRLSDPESDMSRSLLMYAMNGLKRYLQEGPNALNKVPGAVKSTSDEFSRESDPLRYMLIDWMESEDMEKRNYIHGKTSSEIAYRLKEMHPKTYGEQSERGLATKIGAKLRSIDGVNQTRRTSKSRGMWMIDERNLEQTEFMETDDGDSDEFSSFQVH